MFAQNTVTGVFSDYAGQKISLVGFSGFDTYIVNSTTANAEGVFSLSFSGNDCGMAMLASESCQTFLVVLAENEDLQLKGRNFADTENIEIINGHQNQVFAQYATEHPIREEALNAWNFLEQLYEENAILAKHKDVKQAILWEQAQLKGRNFADTENIEIVNGHQNQVFAQYATEHPIREEALNAWNFLEQLYEENAILAKHKDVKQAILWEQAQLKGEEEKFMTMVTA